MKISAILLASTGASVATAGAVQPVERGMRSLQSGEQFTLQTAGISTVQALAKRSDFGRAIKPVILGMRSIERKRTDKADFHHLKAAGNHETGATYQVSSDGKFGLFTNISGTAYAIAPFETVAAHDDFVPLGHFSGKSSTSGGKWSAGANSTLVWTGSDGKSPGFLQCNFAHNFTQIFVRKHSESSKHTPANCLNVALKYKDV